MIFYTCEFCNLNVDENKGHICGPYSEREMERKRMQKTQEELDRKLERLESLISKLEEKVL